jgi:hypothetical protein
MSREGTDAPGKHRRIDQDEYVKRVAVPGTSGRHEAEVEGKDRACRHHAL